MKSISVLIPIAGILLLLVLAVPLVKFYEQADTISLETRSVGDRVEIILVYGPSVPLTDYRLAVYRGDQLLNETVGDVLEGGSTAVVVVSAEDLQDLNNISIVISGKIDGIYYIEVRLHR